MVAIAGQTRLAPAIAASVEADLIPARLSRNDRALAVDGATILAAIGGRQSRGASIVRTGLTLCAMTMQHEAGTPKRLGVADIYPSSASVSFGTDIAEVFLNLWRAAHGSSTKGFKGVSIGVYWTDEQGSPLTPAAFLALASANWERASRVLDPTSRTYYLHASSADVFLAERRVSKGKFWPECEPQERQAKHDASKLMFCGDYVYVAAGDPVWYAICDEAAGRVDLVIGHSDLDRYYLDRPYGVGFFKPGPDRKNRISCGRRSHVFGLDEVSSPRKRRSRNPGTNPDLDPRSSRSPNITRERPQLPNFARALPRSICARLPGGSPSFAKRSRNWRIHPEMGKRTSPRTSPSLRVSSRAGRHCVSLMSSRLWKPKRYSIAWRTTNPLPTMTRLRSQVWALIPGMSRRRE